MQSQQGSYILFLKGKRGQAIFDRILALKPESKEDIEKKRKELRAKFEKQESV